MFLLFGLPRFPLACRDSYVEYQNNYSHNTWYVGDLAWEAFIHMAATWYFDPDEIMQ